MKKKILLVLMILYGSCIFAESNTKKLDGFWGIKWGSSMVEAKKIMGKKSSCSFIGSDSKTFLYSGTFGGRDCEIILFFYNDKLYDAVIAYKPGTMPIFSLYEEIASLVTKKYGSPYQDIKIFKPPYSEGDGYEESAIRRGKTTIGKIWFFDNQNEIHLLITDTFRILLSYTNYEIKLEKENAKNSKNSEDF